jgi:hypothetical protein
MGVRRGEGRLEVRGWRACRGKNTIAAAVAPKAADGGSGGKARGASSNWQGLQLQSCSAPREATHRSPSRGSR